MPDYRCPVCGATLDADATGLQCIHGHRFDRAREGYVNLLPGGRLKGSPAGDSDSMVRARRRVFDAALYRPIIDAVATAVADHITGAATGAGAILDCGCGEGSYLAAAALCSDGEGWGIDISKPAIRLAARRNPALHFAVASSYALPFADGVFDAIINVFSPRPGEEMMRVLRPGGVAVVVTPGADHLHQLKAFVYDEPRPHVESSPAGAESGAVTGTVHTSTVRFDVQLDQPAMRTALLEMTPFWWSATPDRQRTIAEAASVVTVDMRLTIHRRPGHRRLA